VVAVGSLVSLVMSDIVDSTRRWAADESAMAADLEVHDRLIRDVVEDAGGSVFKHTGDGMIAVFDDPVAAVGAAAEVQRAIGATQWRHPDGVRVRAAVHSGVVYPRDGDLFGTAVNKVARLLGTCPPGAVLVSGATAGLLTERAPEGLTVRRVGSASLKGFAMPDEVYAVSGKAVVEVDDLAVAGPSAERGAAVPAIDEELVGRSDELAAIWDAIGRARLVTLVGVGGMGKTRLALEVAAGAVDAFAGGVWWIDLANATSDEAVLPVAMVAVGARETPGRTPMQALGDRFTGVTGLIVVDNCEHVLDAARAMTEALRVAAPDVRIVATSREGLGLRGEQIVPIGSLPPDHGFELFCERALAVRPDLDMAASRDVIARLCARLDGIPLAIELAAARCRSMTPTEIDGLLDDRFRLLRGGRAGAERHRTLQAAVAWSYSLLDGDERTVFDQMAVFAGGTLIEGLAAVTGLDRFDLLDTVDRLISRSMVVATTTPFGTRYHQLETLRQYAEDRLVEAGTFEAVRDRHLDWVVAFATGLPRRGTIDEIRTAFQRFAAEVDNLRVAVAHALVSARHGAAQRIVAGVQHFAYHQPVWEVLDWVRPVTIEGEWTDDAAVCAAIGAFTDYRRGRETADVSTLGGVPERFLVTNARVVSLQALFLRTPGGSTGLQELIDRFEPVDDYGMLIADRSRVFLSYRRQFVDELGGEEIDELTALCAATVDRARRLGEPVELVTTLFLAGYALMACRPDLAVPLARESVSVAGAIGADYLTDYTHTALAVTLVRSSPADVRDADRLTELRQLLADALARKHFHDAGVLAVALIPTLAVADPDVATLVGLAFSRHTGVALNRDLERAGVPLVDDMATSAERLANVTLVDALEAAVAVLDRMIATITDTESVSVSDRFS